MIVAKAGGRKIDLSGCPPVHILANEGKDLRDALTHPSQYVSTKSGRQDKLALVTGINLELVELIFEAAKQYVCVVEEGPCRNPRDMVLGFWWSP